MITKVLKNIKIKEKSLEILKDTDNYTLIKAHTDNFTGNKKYECQGGHISGENARK